MIAAYLKKSWTFKHNIIKVKVFSLVFEASIAERIHKDIMSGYELVSPVIDAEEDVHLALQFELLQVEALVRSIAKPKNVWYN